MAISSNSFQYCDLAFFRSFSCSPVPRSRCDGPFAAATARFAKLTAPLATLLTASGPGTDTSSAFPPSALIRLLTSRAWLRVSLRWSCSRLRYALSVVIETSAVNAVSSSFSLPYASFRYCTSFRSRAFSSLAKGDSSVWKFRVPLGPTRVRVL